MGVSGPSLLIESTDSMIFFINFVIGVYPAIPHAQTVGHSSGVGMSGA